MFILCHPYGDDVGREVVELCHGRVVEKLASDVKSQLLLPLNGCFFLFSFVCFVLSFVGGGCRQFQGTEGRLTRVGR